MEREVVQRLAYFPKPAVISLGGGALIDQGNRRAVQESGWIVYIESAPRAILQRVKHTEKRPLLNDLSPAGDVETALLRRIKELLDVRRPVYEQADIVFQRDAYEWPEAARLIYRRLKEKDML
jgi:shikimate kinase